MTVFRKTSNPCSKSMYADKILLNKFLALPIFLMIMGFVFFMTFETADCLFKVPLSHSIDKLSEIVSYYLYGKGISPMVHALIIQGIFPGVGSVLSFVPIIAALFFFLAIMESCGYMDRVAVILKKPMSFLGLPGEAAVSLVSGFGCSVPAIMAASSLPQEKNKKLAIAMIPFISCSAKLPIYMIFTDTFFVSHKTLILTAVYSCGILSGTAYIFILRKLSILKGFKTKSSDTSAFSYDEKTKLSPYHVPSWKYICSHVYQNTIGFIKKAFTVIFAASILVWFLENFNIFLEPVVSAKSSILAYISHFFTPLFSPLGFGDDRAVSALITGLCAKESVAGTFNILAQSGGYSSITAMLSYIFSPLSAFSFMIFCLLYAPCIGALSAIHNVFGSWKYSLYVFVFHNMSAWAISFIIFNLGSIIIEVFFNLP